MILTDKQLKEVCSRGEIVIEPFEEAHVHQRVTICVLASKE